jgi:hypothetical protein
MSMAAPRSSDKRIPKSLQETHHGQTPTTHLNPDREIEQALHRDIRLRIGLYAVTALILTKTMILIRWVWRKMRVRGEVSENRS